MIRVRMRQKHRIELVQTCAQRLCAKIGWYVHQQRCPVFLNQDGGA